MIRLFRILALVMAALWLPATAHCELDALNAPDAGQTETDDCCTPQPQTGCHEDNCDTVDGKTLLPTSQPLKSPAAIALAETLDFEFRANLPAPNETPLFLGPDLFDRPLNWTPVWQFARRAAGLARAPSFCS